MSIEYITMAFRTDMPTVRKFVLLAMCDMANIADNGLTYPSIATIARHCSVDRRTVERAIKELEADGYLTALRRPGMKSRYQLNLEMLAQASAAYSEEKEAYLRQKVAGGRESRAAESRNTNGETPHLPAAESRTTYGRKSYITGSNQNVEPEKEPEKEKAVAADAADDSLFEMFWSVYDYKIDRQKALKAWQKLKVDNELARRICQAAQRYVAATPELKFRRHPTTWLNNRSWENEIVNQQTQPQMTHHQATTLAAARAIFGDERKLQNSRIINVTPKRPRIENFDDIDYGETGLL